MLNTPDYSKVPKPKRKSVLKRTKTYTPRRSPTATRTSVTGSNRTGPTGIAYTGQPRLVTTTVGAAGPPSPGTEDLVGGAVRRAARVAKGGAVKTRKNAQSERPRSSTGTRSSGSSASGSGGGGGSAAVGRPAGSSEGARTRSREATAAGRETGAEAAAQLTQGPSLFDAARRQLDNESARMQKLREQRIREMERFDAFIQQARAQSTGTLQQQYASSAASAQASAQAGAQRVADLAAQATAALGANAGADTAQAAGITATNDSFGFQRQADGIASAANAFTESNLMTRNTERQNADFARSRETRAEIDANYDAFLKRLSDQRLGIETEETKAAISQANADRQFALDQQAAQFLQEYRAGQLGVEQANAETRRLQAETQQQVALSNANYRQQALQLRAAIAEGQLTAKQAALEWKRRVDVAKLRGADRDRALKVGQNQIRLAQQIQRSNTGATQFLQNFVTNRLATAGGDWHKTDNPFKAATVRGAIAALASQHPNLTRSQAVNLLTAQFGAPLMQSNPDYLRVINANFGG